MWSGCKNQNGLHIFPDILGEIGYQRCTWDWIPPNDIFDDIEVLFGFPTNFCTPYPTPTPTKSPSKSPTVPSSSPSNYPT